MEPEEKDFMRYAVPCNKNNGLRSQVSEHFWKANYCLFDIRTADNELTDMRFIKNPFLTLEKKRLKAAELLVSNQIDKLFTKESIAQKSAFYVLREAYVKFEETDAETIEGILKDLSPTSLG